MAAVMAGQAGLVMNGSAVNMGRYQFMLGMINQNMPQIANNAYQGMGMMSTFMAGMMSQMQTLLAGLPATGGFGNYSGMFRNMTSSRYFWSTSTGTTTPTTPMSGGMMR